MLIGESMTAKGDKYIFEWIREDKGLVFPIQIGKTTESARSPDNLICGECETKVSQFYICDNCSTKRTIGQLGKRKNKDTGVVFTKQEYNNFMAQKVGKKVKVLGELPINAVFPKHLELVERNDNEIFNNDDNYKDYVLKTREYLFLKGLALMVEMGRRDRLKKCLLIPTGQKLLVVELRDKRVVRDTLQKNGILKVEKTETDIQLYDFSKDNSIDNYFEFLDLKQRGVEIKVEEKKVEVAQKTDLFFEDELEDLKNGKEVAVEVKG